MLSRVTYTSEVRRTTGLSASLAAAIRPILKPLNRELARRDEEAVTREEWPGLDDALHEADSAGFSLGMRCASCEGYLDVDGEGGFTCLNCARSATPRRDLEELVEDLADQLIANRHPGV